jgi:hypothetical protein
VITALQSAAAFPTSPLAPDARRAEVQAGVAKSEGLEEEEEFGAAGGIGVEIRTGQLAEMEGGRRVN